jgi:hypothetical protein
MWSRWPRACTQSIGSPGESATASCLAAACAGDIESFVARWRPNDVRALVELAVQHRVDGLLVRAAARSGLSHPALDAARVRVKFHALMHLKRVSLVRDLATALRDARIDALLLKGPVLQELAWRSVPRAYQDLDVLVRRDALGDTLSLVERIGGRVIDRNWTMLARELYGEVHCCLPDGTSLDVHWHLVNHSGMRSRYLLRPDELFARARAFAPAGDWIRVLDAEDGLLHVALHAAISGGHQLIWLTDIKLLIDNEDIDWSLVVARARAWHIGLPVAAMLGRAQRTLGAKVPDVAVHALVSRPQRMLVRSLSSWRPAGHLPGGGSMGRVVARSLRDNLPATTRATWDAAYALLQRFVDSHEYWLDPDDRRNVLFPSGGQTGRAKYVAAVGSTNTCGWRRERAVALV